MTNQVVIDWTGVKQGFMAGMTYSELSAKYPIKQAAIRQRACREKWQVRKVEIRNVLSQVKGLEVLEGAKGLIERGNQMLDQMSLDAQNSVSMLIQAHASTGEYDIEALEKRERTAGMLVKRIKETCGLDDVKPTGLVVIGQFTRFEDEPQVKAIDVVSDVSTDNPAKE